jgi:hypothetical protein
MDTIVKSKIWPLQDSSRWQAQVTIETEQGIFIIERSWFAKPAAEAWASTTERSFYGETSIRLEKTVKIS